MFQEEKGKTTKSYLLGRGGSNSFCNAEFLKHGHFNSLREKNYF